MGLDVDYIAGKEALHDIEEILKDLPHGERQEITDKIIEFRDELQESTRSDWTKDEDFFLDTILSTGRYVATRGYGYLPHVTILEIEDILNDSSDSTARRKIKKLIKE